MGPSPEGIATVGLVLLAGGAVLCGGPVGLALLVRWRERQVEARPVGRQGDGPVAVALVALVLVVTVAILAALDLAALVGLFVWCRV
ncbi:MAG: hypothetical protein K2X87_32590 [Gemmataceae bacterium]|nr:hypothetical protein [Gemmataceae bacterium]